MDADAIEQHRFRALAEALGVQGECDKSFSDSMISEWGEEAVIGFEAHLLAASVKDTARERRDRFGQTIQRLAEKAGPSTRAPGQPEPTLHDLFKRAAERPSDYDVTAQGDVILHRAPEASE